MREPVNPHGFDEHRLAIEERGKTIDRINAYQTDTRQRVDTLIKSIFILCGGSLTISIGIFLRNDAPQLTNQLMCYLQYSWALLFFSLTTSALVLFTMVCQGYYIGELWKKTLDNEESGIEKNKILILSRITNWVFGVSGFFAFIVGMGALAYVSISAIK